MKRKLHLLTKLVLSCMLVSFLSCENSEPTINQQIAQEKSQAEKIKDAEKWFNAYKTSSKTGKSVDNAFNRAFQNIDYYWENADIVPIEDSLSVVVVPIKDSPENPNYKGQKMLYLYPSDSKYKSVIQEIFPDSDTIISDDIKKEGFTDLNSFSGYIITWDLKGNFINGARFKNNKLLNMIQARFISSEYAVSKPNSSTSKEKPPIFLDEVIVYGGSGGPSNPIGIKNDFSIGSSVSGSTGGYLGSGGGGSGAGALTGVASIKTRAQFVEAIESADPNAYNISFVQNGNSITATATIALTIFANIALEIPQTKVGDKYVVNNVVTSITGVTTGLSWSQTTYSQTTSGNTTTVLFNGVASIVMPIEGLGTIYSYQMSYSIKINNTNGKIISGARIK